MKYTKIPADTFKQLQMNGGILLSEFTPSSGSFEATAQLGATSGGITFAATPTFKDMGDGIDNCPKNMMELKQIESWEAKISGDYVTLTPNTAKSLVAASDLDTDKITPRSTLKTDDFNDIWLVGDYSDKTGATNGGFIAIHLMNALSTGGFQMKTSDKDKGKFSFEYTAHYSMDAQDTVPFEIYVHAGTDET